MNHKNLFANSALAAAVALVATHVSAAGFQLNEFSAVGLGRAYSGEGAIGDTAASASRNPATMALMDRTMFSIGAVYVDPGVDITGRTASGNSLDAKKTLLPISGSPTSIMFIRSTINGGLAPRQPAIMNSRQNTMIVTLLVATAVKLT